MKTVSIIIPVYNSQCYIERCLTSIYSQPIKEEVYEVICINDCSRDNSISILKRCQENHANLTIISNRKNLKQGESRNIGLHQAKSQYVWFIDSDDYIESDAMPLILKNLENKPDILQFHAKKVSLDGSSSFDDYLNEPIDQITGIEYLKYEMSRNYENRIKAVWSKIYKRTFLLEHDLFFEKGVYWEDVTYTLKSMLLAKSFKYVPLLLYNYMENRNSDLRSQLNGKKFADTIRFCINGVSLIASQGIENDLAMFLTRYYHKTILKYQKMISRLSFLDFFILNYEIRKMNLGCLVARFEANDIFWLLSFFQRYKLWKNKLN